MTVKPFKISKEATAEQRSAERQADPSASTSRQEEFGMSRRLSYPAVKLPEYEYVHYHLRNHFLSLTRAHIFL